MEIFKTKSEIRDFIHRQKSQGKTIGFVPTMGALHQGHLSLIDDAKKHSDIIICSIFVNPIQFGVNEDFSKYPRQEDKDIELLKTKGCSAVFMPLKEEIYSSENITKIMPQKYTDVLCGKFRPGHFEGVCLVVTKLLNIVTPDVAVFGQKDFQQLFLIKKLVEDLDINTKIIGAKILKEQDGLAMSSRNQYLSPVERNIAGKLNTILKETLANKNLEKGKREILEAGFDKIDYLEFRQQDNLEETKDFNDNTRIFAAAWLGKTRLIDNISYDA